MKLDLEKLIEEHKIIAILRSVPSEKVEAYLKAIYDGGVRLVEIALNSPDALEQIKLARSLYEGKLIIGAGTAVTIQLAKAAVEAGAEFLLSPSSDESVLDYCQNQNIPLLPGVMAPSDVSLCTRYGFRTLKLFPAGDLPLSYINSLNGPFPGNHYVAVGGVGPANIANFLKQGFVGVGIGSNLVPKDFVKLDRWEEARDYVSELVNRIKQ